MQAEDLPKTFLDIMLEMMLLTVLIIFAIVELRQTNLVCSATKISVRILNPHKFTERRARLKSILVQLILKILTVMAKMENLTREIQSQAALVEMKTGNLPCIMAGIVKYQILIYAILILRKG